MHGKLDMKCNQSQWGMLFHKLHAINTLARQGDLAYFLRGLEDIRLPDVHMQAIFA